MKCTLRKVEQGIVATIDKRPKENELYYSEKHNMICIEDEMSYPWSKIDEKDHKIIASNLGVGMELWLVQQGQVPFIPNEVNSHFFMNKEYSYSIVYGKVVVEL